MPHVMTHGGWDLAQKSEHANADWCRKINDKEMQIQLTILSDYITFTTYKLQNVRAKIMVPCNNAIIHTLRTLTFYI